MTDDQKYPLFCSPREEEITKTIGKWNQGYKVAHSQLGIKDTTVRSHQTRVFKRYLEALEFMAENYDQYHRRFKKHAERIKAIKREMNKRRRAVQRR